MLADVVSRLAECCGSEISEKEKSFRIKLLDQLSINALVVHKGTDHVFV